MILVEEPPLVAEAGAGLYARVPGHDQRGDLDRQVATEVLTSFCARLYGCRPARIRAEKALRCAGRDVGPMALSQAQGKLVS
jgi:predicted site-specific integrase-resolvase